MATNSIRIVVVDSYMSSPIQGLDMMYSEFRGSSISHVPILRCFGSTAEGRKICVHIHGVFPYFYLPYDGIGDSKTVMYQIASSIDKAVNISLNQGNSNSQHVYKISLVSGIPMYGFHYKNHQFFKIYLYNPMLVTRVCNLLKSDSILGKFYQPHEAHINFTLQFMMDHNLHGMSTMVVDNMKYRLNQNSSNEESIPKDHYLPPTVHRTSICDLEADVLADNILNRDEIANGALGANPGIATLWEDERQRRRNKGETSQIGQFLELSRTNVPPTKSHLIFKQALLERLAIASVDESSQKDDTDPANLSVYPAETPEDIDLPNASTMDFHQNTPSLDESSFICTQDEDKSIDVTMDENALNLIEILEELVANVKREENEENSKENDSILSQTMIKNNEDTTEDRSDDELDLSMPLEAVTTPRKFLHKDFMNKSNDSDEDIFDTTLVPQLDGADNTKNCNSVRKKKTRKRPKELSKNNREKKNFGVCESMIPTVKEDDKSKIEMDQEYNLLQKFVPKPVCIKLEKLSPDMLNIHRRPQNHMPILDENWNVPLDYKPVIKLETRIKRCLSRKKHQDKPQWYDIQQMIKRDPYFLRSRPYPNYLECPSEDSDDEKKVFELLNPCTEKAIDIFAKRILYINRQIWNRKVIERMRKKEARFCELAKIFKPKINPVSLDKYALLTKKESSKNTIIENILKQTKNHIDPNLHIIVRYPNKVNFLYTYNGKYYPQISPISSDINDNLVLNRFNKYAKIKFENDSEIDNKTPKNALNQTLNGTLINNQTKSINDSDPVPKHSQNLNSNNNNGGSDHTNEQNDCQTPNKNNIFICSKSPRKNILVKDCDVVQNNENTTDFDTATVTGKSPDESTLKFLSKESTSSKNKKLRLRKDLDKLYYQHLNTKGLKKEVLMLKTQRKKQREVNLNKISIRKVRTSNSSSTLKIDVKSPEECTKNSGVGRIVTLQNNTTHFNIKVTFPTNDVSKENHPKALKRGNNNSILDSVATKKIKLNRDFLKKPKETVNSFEKSTMYIFSDNYIDENQNLANFDSENHKSTEEILNELNEDLKKHKRFLKQLDYFPTNHKQMFESNKEMNTELTGSDETTTSGVNIVCKPQSFSDESTNLLHLDLDNIKHINDLSNTKNINKQNGCAKKFADLKEFEIQRPRFSKNNCSTSSFRININSKRSEILQNSTVNSSLLRSLDLKKCASRGDGVSCSKDIIMSDDIVNGTTKTNIPFLSLDGAYDTDTSESSDSPIKKNKKKKLSQKKPSKYKPLLISTTKSPGRLKATQEKTVEMIKDVETESTQRSKTICDIEAVKRKIDFPDLLPIKNKSLLEETVTKSSSFNIKTEDKLDNNICDINSEKESKTLERTFTDFSYNSDTDIFPSSDSEDTFFTDRLNLTAAEIYDRKNNYKAKEGCSTVFTPEDSQKLSGSKSNNSSSLDVLTPYQIDHSEFPPFIPDDVDSDLDETIKESEVEETLRSSLTIVMPKFKPPTFEEVQNSLDQYNIPHVKQEEPFYSNPEDVSGSIEIGLIALKICSKTTADLPEFDSQNDALNCYRKAFIKDSVNLKWNANNVKHVKLSYCQHKHVIITPVKKPPSYEEVISWLEQKINSNGQVTPTKHEQSKRVKIYLPGSPSEGNEDMDISLSISPCSTPSQPKPLKKSSQSEDLSMSPVLEKSKKRKRKKQLFQEVKRSKIIPLTQDIANQSCQITGVTVDNSFGFDRSVENLQNARAMVNYQYLTTLAMELHIRTRGDFKPNPEYDAICAIFYSILNDVPDDFSKKKTARGVLVVDSLPMSVDVPLGPILNGIPSDSLEVTYYDSEEQLINEFVKLLEIWDPDILAGYEIQMLSWGYLIERANILSINVLPELGRSKVSNKFFKERTDEQDLEKVTGRIVLDIWRLMRHEIALQSYTFESVVYHILHKRVPMYSFKNLAFWWDHRSMLHRHRTVKYYLYRVDTILELFDKLDLINRTSELARLFGIQFYEVLSRGSQFRVESMMLRLAKPLNFIPVSPNVQQRANMRAPEYIPLVMEPESKLYNDPVIVLDFQSLYPSIIIAYNYCFTTSVGRVELLGKNAPFQFGSTQLKISSKRIQRLVNKDLLNFSPCGVGFVKKKVRDGILPRMLREILDTRLMVKNSMKENKGDEVLRKVLHNRQLGLKLIANVTYGYTAANFSGRMCCVEVGDSVVSKGRETLQRAIAMVDGTPEWGARVVYGDTDSLFVLVPGKTKEVAFEVGQKIAQAITDANPDPIKLKLEKVYQPCILQTKKRYVGYMYESPDQKEPVYDAKGIETVRRDGCPAVAKMLEKSLRLLFETKDVSVIKKYVLRQFHKIMAGRVSIQDLTFAKEYRGFTGYKPGACVPSLELARKWTAVDKRSEPRCGERVPYIIVNGPPGFPLIRLVRSPRELLSDSSLRPNALYYITKVIIPPLNRCFNLIGADINNWFNQMPRKQIQTLPNSCPSAEKKTTISQYFAKSNCASCGEQTQTGLCEKCLKKPQLTVLNLMEKLRNWEQNFGNVLRICQSCTGVLSENTGCISLDCPVLYRMIQTERELKQSHYVRQLLSANFSTADLF